MPFLVTSIIHEGPSVSIQSITLTSPYPWSQCGADAWLNGLASGDQYRLTGSGSALEACSRQCTIQMATFTILYH